MPEEEALEGQASAAIDCGSGELSRLTKLTYCAALVTFKNSAE